MTEPTHILYQQPTAPMLRQAAMALKTHQPLATHHAGLYGLSDIEGFLRTTFPVQLTFMNGINEDGLCLDETVLLDHGIEKTLQEKGLTRKIASLPDFYGAMYLDGGVPRDLVGRFENLFVEDSRLGNGYIAMAPAGNPPAIGHTVFTPEEDESIRERPARPRLPELAHYHLIE